MKDWRTLHLLQAIWHSVRRSVIFEKAVELAHVHFGFHVGKGKFWSFCGRKTRELRFLWSNEQSFDSSGDIHDYGDVFAGVFCVPFNVSSLQARMHSKSLGGPVFRSKRLLMSTLNSRVCSQAI